MSAETTDSVPDELREGRVRIAETHPLHREEVTRHEGEEGVVILTNDDECYVSLQHGADGEYREGVWIRAQWLEPVPEPDGEYTPRDHLEPGCYRLQLPNKPSSWKYVRIGGASEESEMVPTHHWMTNRVKEDYIGIIESHLRGDWNAYRIPCDEMPLSADEMAARIE